LCDADASGVVGRIRDANPTSSKRRYVLRARPAGRRTGGPGGTHAWIL